MKNYKKSKRKGFSLEEYIVNKFKVVDKNARPTKNSGASTELGDIYNKYFIVECKQQLKTDNPKINIKTWYKLLNELYYINKKPLLILENKNGDKFAIMDTEDFFELIYELYGEINE